jgi:Tfp pilus assembly protein PilO
MRGSRAVIAAGAGAVIVALLVVFFLVLPKMGQVGEAEQELEDAQAEQQTLQSRLAALEQAQEEAPANEAQIRAVDRLVPPTADLPGLILFLRNAATSSGVQVLSLTPANPVASEDAAFSSISVSASGEATYFSLVRYLYRIETLPRAATVQSIDLSPTEGTLSFAATITLYTSDVSSGPGSEPGPTQGTTTTTTTGA